MLPNQIIKGLYILYIYIYIYDRRLTTVHPFDILFVLHIQWNIDPHQMIRQTTMKSTCLLVVASVMVCNFILCGGQGMPDEYELDRMTIDDIILQRAEDLVLQSILRKMQSENGRSGV